MQLFAMLTMFIDHVGYLFFPEYPIFRWIGRLAMPLYAYGIAVGYRRTANMTRYMQRLGIIAVLTQWPYMLAFHTTTINIVGTFLVALGVLWVIGRIPLIVGKMAVVAVAAALLEVLPFEYGGYALLLVLIYYFASLQWMLPAHVGLNLIFIFYKGWIMAMASAASSAILSLYPEFAGWGRRFIPRWLWLAFYPAHLLLLVLLRYAFTVFD